jgi:ubiquinone/menaquinone biosynthesis C-methylase UbiE
MSREAAFDVLAADYDIHFSQSLTGQAQRTVSRAWLLSFLLYKGPLRILEINCGTGEDALWLASLGHTVVATDQSQSMIREAERKSSLEVQPLTPVFITCGFSELSTTLANERFDLVFSNFAGLNCASPQELATLNHTFQGLLTEGGFLAVVLFGKYCWWETCYFLLKAERRNAFRRWSRKPVQVQLTEEVHQQVFYYSVNQFTKNLQQFLLLEKRPVGLFIPPSYMEHLMRRNTRIFSLLVKLEKWTRGSSLYSALSDHTYILLQKHVP